ncbi:hypothetical protein [Flavihumibacter fluvii]|uniref:bestrophin-like domain n=1 Tax=Flavihumibacter fluvii TaxID=2838157 RepID=UPI001BDE1E98|nr:hypothetical protein [Flavihumibacter fluvii]ULQ54080.1 hypothetical protein KJS93_07075 [Flavihumibacter fluvii]
MFLKTYFFFLPASLISLCLMVLMLLAIYLGFRLSKKIHPSKQHEDTTAPSFITALFGLTAFILGFSFSMASGRFELRRSAIVQEANTIGTAILRTNLYPDSVRNQMNDLFRKYVDARIAYNNVHISDTTGMADLIAETENISGKLFLLAANYSKLPNTLVPSNQMIPALNEMIDIATTRHQSYLAIVPESIIIMLFLLTICSGFLTGYSNKGDSIDWLVASGFCILTALVIYITLDLDRPRRGLIKLEQEENLMIKIRSTLN